MTSQLFKDPIPCSILYDFLEKICIKDNASYIFSKAAFKKAEIYDIISDFKEQIKPYYHQSKQYYVERDLNFIRFMTVIKQICSLNNIIVLRKIIYNKSTYEIEYYISII